MNEIYLIEKKCISYYKSQNDTFTGFEDYSLIIFEISHHYNMAFIMIKILILL